MSEGRRYSESEFALILSKAAELRPPGERGDMVEADHAAGLSLEEMKAIASEVGMDPALIERAARLLPREHDDSALTRLIGGPTKLRLEHVVPMRVDEDSVPALSNTIRAAAERHGTLETNAAGLEWSSVEEASRMHVTATREGGSTRIVVTADRSGGLVVTGVMAGLGTFAVGLGVLVALEGLDVGSPLIGWPVFLGSMGAFVATARATWVRGSRRMQARLQRIMDGAVRVLDRQEPKELEEP